MRGSILVAVAILALAMVVPASADWDYSQPYKWLQEPDLDPFTGADVNATFPYILADDFLCTQTGWITDIHVWGSWYHDVLPEGDPNAVIFTLSIHADIPAEQSPTGYSMPGELLWMTTFNPGDFVAQIWLEGEPEGWIEQPDFYEAGTDSTCWQYNFFLDAAQAFYQVGTPEEPVVYWLDLQAQPLDPGAFFGWKCSLNHWNDDAVWVLGEEPWMEDWFELIYPFGHPFMGESIDLAFVITGEPDVELDWGDAPDPLYPTLAASNGANHVLVSPVYMGAGVDPDPDGQPDPNALGDDNDGNDDEDGVVFTTPLIPGQPASVQITTTLGIIDGWVDFGADGSWFELGDQIIFSQPVLPGVHQFNFNVPAAAPMGAQTFGRFRISTVGGLPPTGPAPDGEVEDHEVYIGEGQVYKWIQRPDLFETGIDVDATDPYLLADDFLCTDTGVITEIEVWGSWLNDYLPFGGDPLAMIFTLSFHADIPADESPTGYSMPGDVLWIQDFAPGQFDVEIEAENLMEGWMEPPDNWWWPADSICWKYTFFVDWTEAFYQLGTPSNPVVYWLDLQAHPEDPEARFGWKTSLDHWNDDAVWGDGVEPYFGPWFELRYPLGHEFHPESIDLAFSVTSEPVDAIDWGDAPDPTYPTLAGSGGANHVIVPGVFMGASVDPEINGQPDPNALGDDNDGNDDEDGVTFTSLIVQGGLATVTVTSSVPATLSGWLDFDINGSWADPGEQIFVNTFLNAGANNLSFNIPAGATAGQTFARFRMSTFGGLPITGAASDGEVEDYKVTIVPAEDFKWIQFPDLSTWGIDVNASDPYILADDFLCDESGPLVGIHLFGSWLNDYLPNGDPNQVLFQLSIHEDIPADESPTGYSMPGETLWLGLFAPGDFTVAVWQDGLEEGWLDPPDAYIFPADDTCWRYDFFIDRSNAFWQYGTPDTTMIYWLDVQAYPQDALARFGWKTSLDHWNDDAVWIQGAEPYYGDWFELRYPPDHEFYPESIDLAFGLTWEEGQLDFGDAPDPTYPTTWLSGGARHVIVPGFFLGAGVDADPNGQPDATATGDDNDGNDDEDGVPFMSPLIAGQGATIHVMASMPGVLDGWVDFDGDGGWFTLGEQIFPSVPLVAGLNILTFNVPAGAAVGPTFMRLRYSSLGGLAYSGFAPDGEVEDHRVTIEEQTLDWGDAPDPTYPTLLLSNGANHPIVPGVFLGALIDAEPNGQPNANATGDDINNLADEDGVAFTAPLIPGQMSAVTVVASVNGVVDGWIDFNADGDWNDPGEQIFAAAFVVAGGNALNFNVPASAVVGPTFARFRYNTSGVGLPVTGPGPDGEVEDYQIHITDLGTFKWIQEPDLSPWGIDVSATLPYILADDFECTQPGYITDLHVWGSWLNDELPMGDPSMVTFILSLHADIPADQSPTGYSMPGELLWLRTFFPGEFGVDLWAGGLIEGWMEPPDFYLPFGDTMCWYYSFFIDPGEALWQQGTPDAPVVYWLDVQAIPEGPGTWFGWKTSLAHWNDDAVWGLGSEPYFDDWFELIYPPEHELYPESIDLAFGVTGEPEEPFDWGDAPDPTYPTLAASNGAFHPIVPGLFMGALVDPDPDGQPDPNALGDDNDGIDDEDGVTFTTPLTPGQIATVQIVASAPGFVDAWVDFGADGGWPEPGDQILFAAPVAPGVNLLNFNVPAGSTPGPTFARFRYSTAGGLPFTGGAPDGEVEDYTVHVEEETVDWGDAPDPTYPTLALSNGASHIIVPGMFMGALIDAEPNGLPDPNALGDDNNNLPDEDGVVLTSPIIPGQIATVDITVSVPGFIDAWIDFGLDGGWAEPVDQIFVSVPVNPGLNSLAFTVPGSAVPLVQTFARFRYSTNGGLTYTGQAPDGEIEDYGIFIEESDYKWIQTPDLTPTGIDVNATVTYVLADDFECREPGRLTEFYVWGSWLDDFVPDPMAVSFTLSIHADIPDSVSPTGYSMPADPLWVKTFVPGEFVVDIWADQILEGWMNPPDGYFFPADTVCWLYTFFVQPEDAFHQVGMPDDPIVYWLDVQAWPEFPGMQFGWKTSLEHWNDDAVWGEGIEPYPGPWFELRYPPGHPFAPESIDLAFAIRSTYGTDVPEEEEEIPQAFGLYQNVPNPFNPTTTIGYDVPAGGGRVRIDVFDVSGRLVTTLVDEVLPEGRRSVAWHGVDDRGAELPSGVYFYRMNAGDYVETRKMLLLK